MFSFRRHLFGSLPLIAAAAALACGGESLVVPTTGTLQVTTSTDGTDPDADGYIVTVDGTDHGAIQATGTASVESVAEGDHVVGLSEVAGNCQVQGDNPRTVAITAGATTTATFAVTCSPLPPNSGSLQITTATIGPNADPNGYTVAVDGGATQPIASNGSLTISGIAAAAHTVALAGVAPNCTVAGGNLITITVTTGQTATAAFSLTCTATAQARITFVRGDDKLGDVFTVNPDRTDRRRLTDGRTGFADTPQWSPDRSKIVFEGGPDVGEIWVINADGNGLRNLTNTPNSVGGARETGPKWSPDGSRILFTKTTLVDEDIEESDLFTMSADGGGQVQLTHTGREVGGGGYDWSPDGSQIAFGSERNGAPMSIYVMQADGSGPTQMTHAGISFAPDWSPDGKRIVYLGQQGAVVEIWAINADGTGEGSLTNQGGDKKDPTWSQDGSKIVYAYATSVTSSNVWTVNADGTGEFNVTGSGDNTSPVWSPDGRQIAFVVDFGISADAARVWVVNADGTGGRNVSDLPGFRPDW